MTAAGALAGAAAGGEGGRGAIAAGAAHQHHHAGSGGGGPGGGKSGFVGGSLGSRGERNDMLGRLLAELCRVGAEKVKLREEYSPLRDYVAAESRELSGESFSRFLSDLYRRIHSLLNRYASFCLLFMQTRSYACSCGCGPSRVLPGADTALVFLSFCFAL